MWKLPPPPSQILLGRLSIVQYEIVNWKQCISFGCLTIEVHVYNNNLQCLGWVQNCIAQVSHTYTGCGVASAERLKMKTPLSM